MLNYTNIQHVFRKEHKLSCNEYVLCDMIFFLSSTKDSKVPGWCYMTKESMAEEIGLTKQAILNMIDRLVERGFLVKNEQTKYLQTTSKWQQAYFTNSKETLPEVNKVATDGKETLPQSGKETLPNNNSSNKDIDNNVDADVSGRLTAEEVKLFANRRYTTWTKDEFRKMCDVFKGRKLKNGEVYSIGELDGFFEVWTQVSRSGKYRYQEANGWNWTLKLANYRNQQKIIDERQKQIENGAAAHKQSSKSPYSAGFTKPGTSEERTDAIADRLRRSQVLRDTQANGAGEDAAA